MIYTTDFQGYIKKILPPFLQQVRQLAWLQALLAPVQSLHDDFLDYIINVRYRVNLTGQVIYLEHYLNDLFDSERRIYITDGSPELPPYLFLKQEDEPIRLYNKADNQPSFYLKNLVDFEFQYDFIVFVPAAIVLTEEFRNRIKGAVNQFKIAGKKYKIENF